MKTTIQLLAVLIFNFLFLTFNCEATTTEQQAKQLLSKQNEKGLIENQGQMIDMEGNPVPFVLFKTDAPGVNLWITEQGMTIQTLQIRKEPLTGKELEEWEAAGGELSGQKKTKKFFDWERIDLSLKGASIKKENIIKENPMQGHTNYFYPHCPDGIYGVKEYQKVTIQNVYPNIDWVIYRTPEHHFKYDFIVHPGADSKQIELLYKSKTPIKINPGGELELYTEYGNIKEQMPVSFYEGKEIETKFKLKEQKPITIHGDSGYETSISFRFSSDFGLQSSDLIIDPQLTWATFYGGNSDDGPISIAADNSDNVFVTGYTSSFNFPVQTAGTFFQGTNGGISDVFMLKFDNLDNLLWATYYGGNGDDRGTSIAADGSGNVFVTGYTKSTDFPVQTAGTFFQGTKGGAADAFMLKFDNLGNLLWATYYGGSGDDYGNSIAVDGSDNVFVTGYTYSNDFPVQTAGTFFQGTYGGGIDAFMLKFDNLGNLLWATYYGGSGGDWGNSIAVDSSGNVFVTGYTWSTNFSVQTAGTFFQGTLAGGFYDAFMLKFNNLGNLLWATYYGGSGNECSLLVTYDNLAIDNCGNVYVSFETSSNPFPHLINSSDAGYYHNTYNGGPSDILLSLFSNSGSLLWCTYWGGNGKDFRTPLAVDANNNLFVSGEWTQVTNSASYPVTDPGGGAYYDATFNGGFDDGFIAKFAAPSVTYTQTQTNANCACDGASLITITRGLPPYSYVWSNGSSTLNTYDTTNTITGLCPGSYTVTATSNCNQSQTVTFVIAGVGSVTPIITGTTIICSGNSTTLTASGGDTYSWSTGATTIAITVSPTITNTYTVTVTNGSYTGATTVVVTVNQNPIISVSPSAICAGGTSTLTATGGTDYLWSTAETTSAITVSPTITTSYSLTATTVGCSTTASAMVIVGSTLVPVITGDTIICNGSSTTLTTAGGTDYLWSITATTSAITIFPTITTTYTVMVTNGSCSGSVSQTVTVNPNPTPGITGTTTICSGNSTALTASGGDTYSWSTTEITTAITVSPTSNTTYTVTATSNAGCTGATMISVTVNPNPTPSITGATTICIGNSTTLTATGGGTYNWSTNETTTAITVSPTNTTTYTVTADNAGCTGSTTAVVSMVSPPTAMAIGATVCEGETINLTSTGGGTYTWNGPNAFTSTLQNPTLTNPTLINSGTYTVTVSNGSCSDTATALVTVNPTPSTNAGNDVSITMGSTTTLTATGGTSYIWMPTTGLDCDTCASVIATPTATTIYCVQSSIGTCNSTDCVTITVETPCPSNKDLAVPNAFSPNADGHNDDFCLEGWNTCIETFIVLIYDRWGEKVFESEKANFCWDGMYRGKIMDPAVFVYYIKAAFTNGNEVVKKGNISLIR